MRVLYLRFYKITKDINLVISEMKHIIKDEKEVVVLNVAASERNETMIAVVRSVVVLGNIPVLVLLTVCAARRGQAVK